jgi:ribulose-phosphate 3-epimerase
VSSSPAPAVALTELHVAPSILSADFARLGSQVTEVLDAGARLIHVDVMDGHFVPPITFGAVVVSALADLVHDAGAIIDVHMMVDRPERHVADIATAGADSITIHVEATPHVHYTLQAIREAGCRACAAICPATPVDVLADVWPDALDMALCMTVNPGWGAQSFIPHSLEKVLRLRAALPDTVGLEVDGGIHEQSAGSVVRAGANVLVAGSAVFSSADPGATYQRIAAAAGER